MVKQWGDAGESRHVHFEDCVFFAPYNEPMRAYVDGQAGEIVNIIDTISIHAGINSTWRSAINIGGHTDAVTTLQGTDQTAGMLNCVAAINPTWHCFYIHPDGTGSCSGMIAEASYGGQPARPRPFSSGSYFSGDMTDAIFSTAGPVVDAWNYAANWNNVTLHANDGQSLTYLVGGDGSLTIRNSIFSGGSSFGGRGGGGMPGGGIDMAYSGWPRWGAYAMAALPQVPTDVTPTLPTNMTYDDPMYLNVSDCSGLDYFDVDSQQYGAAGTAASDLAGGADYVGGTALEDWMLY
jgi:hypothetical protein